MRIDQGVTQAERRWLLGFGLLMLFLTSLPYLLALQSQDEIWLFSGHLLAVEDGNSYFGKMLSGAAGAWRFRTPYTAYEQTGVFSFIPYILAGKLAGESHANLILVFHTFRLAGAALMIAGSYGFIAFFVDSVPLRRLGLVLALFGGGLGWLLVAIGRPGWLGSLPLDFISPESFGFLGLFALPHLAAARGLLLFGMVAFLRQKGWLAGALWLLMGLFNPVPPVLAWGITGVYGSVLVLRRWRIHGFQSLWSQDQARLSLDTPLVFFKVWLPAVLVPLPLILYTAISFSADPFLSQWTGQNLILSPHWGHYVAAYGLALPLVVVGLKPALQHRSLRGWLPVVWFFLLPVLAYAPHNLQRRFVEGIWIAIIILLLHGLASLNRPARIGAYLVFPALLLSSLFLFVGSLGAAINPFSPIFVPRQQARGYLYLSDQANPGSIVLTSFETGNVLPAFAPVYVVIGHGPESIRLDALRPRIQAFFDEAGQEADRIALLKEFSVDYVFWGPNEQRLGDWNPHNAAFLTAVFSTEEIVVFAVLP
jgi:hypothetical protein